MTKTIFTGLFTALFAMGSGSLMAQDNTAAPPAQQNAQPAQQNAMPPAQRRMPSPDERAKRQTDRLNQTAQLTPDQYAQILQIQKDFQTQRDAMGTPGGPNQLTPDQRNQMHQIQMQRDAKIKAILTPEQYQKVQDARMKPAPGGHMGE